MDFEILPEIKKAFIERAERGIFGYTYTSEGYYEALIAWFKNRHGWTIEKDWVTHTSGVINALHIALNALAGGEGGIVQTPVYYPFFSIIRKCGMDIITNPLQYENNRYVPDLLDLEHKLKKQNVKALILCNPHNPVGKVYTRDELIAIGELCDKYKVVVLADEIHCDLVYRNYKHIPFASISETFEQNSITCTAVSKTFNLAGLCTSNIIIPNRKLFAMFNAVSERIGLHPTHIFGNLACETGYRYGAAWVSAVVDYIEKNKDYAVAYIRERIPQLAVTEAAGTYFLWINCRKLELNNHELEQFLLHEAGLWLNQGYTFGAEGNGFVRMNIACPRLTVEKALQRLEKAVLSLGQDGASR